MNIDLNSKPEDQAALASPHFDDETTLLSARAVVPLARVESRYRLKRWLPLLGASLIVGILSGVLLVQLGRAGGNNAVEQQKPAGTPGSEANSSTDTHESSSTVASNPKPLEASRSGNAPTAPDKSTAVMKIQPKTNGRIADSQDNQRLDTQEDSITDVGSRHGVRRETRRVERRAERYPHRGRNDRGDDLFRIRDIFEGSSRP